MLLFLTGPTASGKSAVAVALARITGGEIVCGDAYQLYGDLAILTAQPAAEDLAAAPHHLYGSVRLTEEMDAARYARMAEEAIAEIERRGRLAIVTGGSGLYIKALTHGLSPLPTGDPALRAELDSLTTEERTARLLALDPNAGGTVNLRNPRYVQRALEIAILAGRPAVELKTSFRAAPRPGIRGIFLHRDRTELYQRIDERTRQMIAAGVLDEIRVLPPDLSATASKTIGLDELRRVLAGELSPDGATAAIQQATRRYAKRQTTWFRRESWMETIDATGRMPEEIASAIVALLRPKSELP
jgi:tRNA dimethylallyltransferase